MSQGQIILASGSEIRARILLNAGIALSVMKPDFDEDAAKSVLRAQNLSAADLARALAEGKARACMAPESALVIGADQILEFDGELLDKCRSIEEARDRLWALRGKEHGLWSAWAIARSGRILAAGVDYSGLRMREFSEIYLETYLGSAGPCLTRSVGAYEYEGTGAQLFEDVRGDFYAILGLPLLPLLAKLREFGAIDA